MLSLHIFAVERSAGQIGESLLHPYQSDVFSVQAPRKYKEERPHNFGLSMCFFLDGLFVKLSGNIDGQPSFERGSFVIICGVLQRKERSK